MGVKTFGVESSNENNGIKDESSNADKLIVVLRYYLRFPKVFTDVKAIRVHGDAKLIEIITEYGSRSYSLRFVKHIDYKAVNHVEYQILGFDNKYIKGKDVVAYMNNEFDCFEKKWLGW